MRDRLSVRGGREGLWDRREQDRTGQDRTGQDKDMFSFMHSSLRSVEVFESCSSSCRPVRWHFGFGSGRCLAGLAWACMCLHVLCGGQLMDGASDEAGRLVECRFDNRDIWMTSVSYSVGSGHWSVIILLGPVVSMQEPPPGYANCGNY